MTNTHDFNHTVASYFARAHLAAGVRIGLDESELLQFAAISPKLLNQPASRLAPKQLARLMVKIMQQADDEFLGLTRQPARFGLFILLAERLILSNNLRDAMLETKRFYDLVSPALSFEIQEQGDEVSITIKLTDPELDPDNTLIEFLLLVWHRFPSWLIGQVIPMKKVQFMHAPPGHVEEYRLLYPSAREFHQPRYALVWPREVLDLPIHRNADQLRRYISQVPLQWFRKPRFADFQTERVMQILEQSSNPHLTTLEDVAEQLHMTSRTLRRKLTAEGSRFQQMKDDLRRDQAIYWLSQDNVSINEAGERVGYTETASFIRAFKSWTGMSPGQYKKGLHER
ncbi:AraC family transcriptional regulator [Pseudomaricurvus alkylphenolicus]|jgi:AraC-like DNA-binding protein|uniref:AraC family transcriptional regulator n=1 Tax=Pseudomaricurvus alkylphenolicus TaxID=1306991 RepID=UPI00141F710B|nr:AraC family transcriptional regulator [Pseudomaricurvus alkylphenolicus]NIB43025.1 AraC family transcriptional regulator [Pseudomaricurvus alkylphenolicus]